MAIKTLGQIRQEIAEHLGIIDVNGVEAFDNTTAPTLTRVNQIINDVTREVVSDFPYANLERNCWIPFYHTIHEVPSAILYDASGTATTVTPFPDNTALQAGCITLAPNYNFSGISYTDVSGNAAVSVSGSQTTADWNGVGYSYELPYGVDSIVSIMLPQNGIKLSYVPMYDLNRVYPNGLWSSTSTTPVQYTEMPGLSPSGNKMVQFFPMPAPSLSGTSMLVYYKMKQTDLTDDSQQQQVLPDQFQDIIVEGALSKIYILVNDPEKAGIHAAQMRNRLMSLRKWSENQPDYVNRFRDGNYLGSVSTATGADLQVGYLINGFGQ